MESEKVLVPTMILRGFVPSNLECVVVREMTTAM